jgi:hypothetical protein
MFKAVRIGKFSMEILDTEYIPPIYLLDIFPMLKQGLCLDNKTTGYLERIISYDLDCEYIEVDEAIHNELIEEAAVIEQLWSISGANNFRECSIYDISMPPNIHKLKNRLLLHPNVDPLKFCITCGCLRLLSTTFHNQRGNNFNSYCKYFIDNRVRYINAYRMLSQLCPNICNRHSRIKLRERLRKKIIPRLLLFKELLPNDICNYILLSNIF